MSSYSGYGFRQFKKHNRTMINFICFGTDNCENSLRIFYDHLINSCKERFVLHYYSINYESSVVGDNLIIHPFNINFNFGRANFYKPYVLLKSMMDIPENDFVYLDLDIVITKHFSSEELLQKIDSSPTPLSPNHFWEHPYKIINGIETQNAENLSKFYNVNIFNKYVQNCVIIYNKEHFNFMLDWSVLTSNKETLEMVYGDEEIYNFLLWKYEQPNTLGYLCITSGTETTGEFSDSESILKSYQKFEKGEFDKTSFIVNNNFVKNLELDKVMFFHGLKYL